MDFLIEIIRSSIDFVIMGAVAVAGVFLGIALRKKKNESAKK